MKKKKPHFRRNKNISLSQLVLGEPNFGAIFNDARERYFVLPQQVGIFREVIRDNPTFEKARKTLKKEYLSIVSALKTMGVEFNILIAHEEACDKETMEEIRKMGCCVFRVPMGLHEAGALYPRDIITHIQGSMFFMNPTFLLLDEGRDIEAHGTVIKQSPYGEGGRIFVGKDVVLVGSQIIFSPEVCLDALVGEFEGIDIRLGTLPVPLVAEILVGEDSPRRYFINDHLDLASSFLSGENGRGYLVVDEEIHTEENGILFPQESKQKIAEVCRRLDVEMLATGILNPLGANFLQLDDGRVLMSGGDDGLFHLVESVVGRGRVARTDVPIRLYPLLGGGGIRCMTTYFPTIFMRPA